MNFRTIVVSLPVVGLELDGLVVVSYRSVPVAPEVIRCTTAVVRFGIVRREADDLAVIGDGGRVLPFRLISKGTFVVSLSHDGVESEGGVIVGNSAIEVRLIAVRTLIK